MHKKFLIYTIKEPHNEPHEDINLSPTFFPLSLFPTLPLPLTPSLSHHISILSLSRLALMIKRPSDTKSISGLVVEYIVAIDVTRVRFPADAHLACFKRKRRCRGRRGNASRRHRRESQGCAALSSSLATLSSFLIGKVHLVLFVIGLQYNLSISASSAASVV